MASDLLVKASDLLNLLLLKHSRPSCLFLRDVSHTTDETAGPRTSRSDGLRSLTRGQDSAPLREHPKARPPGWGLAVRALLLGPWPTFEALAGMGLPALPSTLAPCIRVLFLQTRSLPNWVLLCLPLAPSFSLQFWLWGWSLQWPRPFPPPIHICHKLEWGLCPVLPSDPVLEKLAARPLLVSVVWTAATRQSPSPAGSRGCSRAEGQPGVPTGSHHAGRGMVVGWGLPPQSCALIPEHQPFASFPSSVHHILGKGGYSSFGIFTRQPGLGLLLDGGLQRFPEAQRSAAPHLPEHRCSHGPEPPRPKCELPAACHRLDTGKEYQLRG